MALMQANGIFDMLSELYKLHKAFCRKHNLDCESADEMLCRDDLTDFQYQWFNKFVEIWDEQQAEDSRGYKERIKAKKTIMWYRLNTGGGCMVYGADFPTRSISLSDDCIVVIVEGYTFNEFWELDAGDSDQFEQNSSGCLPLSKDMTVMNYVSFLERFDLAPYAQEIWMKFKEIGGLR